MNDFEQSKRLPDQDLDTAIQKRVEREINHALVEAVKLLPDTWGKSLVVHYLKSAIEFLPTCFGDAKIRGKE